MYLNHRRLKQLRGSHLWKVHQANYRLDKLEFTGDPNYPWHVFVADFDKCWEDRKALDPTGRYTWLVKFLDKIKDPTLEFAVFHVYQNEQDFLIYEEDPNDESGDSTKSIDFFPTFDKMSAFIGNIVRMNEEKKRWQRNKKRRRR